MNETRPRDSPHNPIRDLRILTVHLSEKVTFHIGEKHTRAAMCGGHFQAMLPLVTIKRDNRKALRPVETIFQRVHPVPLHKLYSRKHVTCQMSPISAGHASLPYVTPE